MSSSKYTSMINMLTAIVTFHILCLGNVLRKTLFMHYCELQHPQMSVGLSQTLSLSLHAISGHTVDE